MIIVSQDKKRIVNFENIIDIWTGEKGTIFFTPIVNINGMDILGYYNTEDRAKEVLQEIMLLFKDEKMLHIRKSTLNNLDELSEPKYILNPVSRPKVFEMPQE